MDSVTNEGDRPVNLFATVLTKKQPCANYRGEAELNRAVIQKVTDGRFDYPIFSPESLRNALRETLREYELPSNRSRLDDEEQLAVRFEDYPDPDAYVDDFFFGYLVAAGKAERADIRKTLATKRSKAAADAFQFKRDSVLRMNLAKALEPYRHNAVFTQSPLDATPKETKKHANATTSALLHRETVVSAFQYPFALALADCKAKPDWTRRLLQAIGELNGVAGNHARSYFEMAPESLIVRLTPRLAAGYDTYCFKTQGVPDVLLDIMAGDYPGEEFYVGGEIVKRGLTAEQSAGLAAKGVTLDRSPQAVLAIVAANFLGGI
jgi:CRISPR-associated protein Cst2